MASSLKNHMLDQDRKHVRVHSHPIECWPVSDLYIPQNDYAYVPGQGLLPPHKISFHFLYQKKCHNVDNINDPNIACDK